ncbi:hydrophobin family protein [Nonomuraea pusilla]|uniref:hydrophobin family protein n=1 Tax=Nonomuraea pusilla TaxID=46177 RepID=UPI0033230EB8
MRSLVLAGSVAASLAVSLAAAALASVPAHAAAQRADVQCCVRAVSSDSEEFRNLAALLGIDPGVAAGKTVGLQCNPVSVLGMGGDSCAYQPMVCEQNYVGGLIAVGCRPATME